MSAIFDWVTILTRLFKKIIIFMLEIKTDYTCTSIKIEEGGGKVINYGMVKRPDTMIW